MFRCRSDSSILKSPLQGLSFRGRQTFCLSSLLTVQASLKRSSRTEAVSASLTRWTEMQAPPGELFPAVSGTDAGHSLLCLWFGVVLSVLFYCQYDRVYFMSSQICQSFDGLMLFFNFLCIRVVTAKWSWKRPVSWACLTDTRSNFPPLWLSGALSSGFFFTHCAFLVFANSFQHLSVQFYNIQ